MPYTSYENPDADHNHRIDNVELSWTAAIAEDTLRNRAREEGKLAVEHYGDHDDVQDGVERGFAAAEEFREDAERIGHMILAREIPEKY